MTGPADVARAYFAAVTDHDADAVAACFADGGELVTATGTYRGRQAIGDFYRQNAFQFDDLRPSPGPFVVEGDRVAVEIDLFMGGRSSPVADFFSVVDGRIERLVVYLLPNA